MEFTGLMPRSALPEKDTPMAITSKPAQYARIFLDISCSFSFLLFSFLTNNKHSNNNESYHISFGGRLSTFFVVKSLSGAKKGLRQAGLRAMIEGV